MAARLVKARHRLAERLQREAPAAVAFYRADAYNAAASLQDNILFGRLAFGRAGAEQIIGDALAEVLDELQLRETVRSEERRVGKEGARTCRSRGARIH